MTLDVEMPKMDGLEFLEKVMRLRPFPVVMVSSLTARGATATIRAMELGAVDCIGKPSIDQPNSFDDLPARSPRRRAARGCTRAAASGGRARVDAASPSYKPDGKIVAIGASTGGVEALIAVIAGYPENCPPTVITLHMPTPFTQSFARRLDGLTGAQVAEAEDGAPIEVGRVYLAPGSAHSSRGGGGAHPRCRLQQQRTGQRPPPVRRRAVRIRWPRPSARSAVGVILTGMGRDGAAGLLAMRRAGASTLGQNEASSVVYGMPKVAFEMRGGRETSCRSATCGAGDPGPDVCAIGKS